MDVFLWSNGKEFHCAILSALLQLVLTRAFADLGNVLVRTKAVVWCLGSVAVDLTEMTDRKRG